MITDSVRTYEKPSLVFWSSEGSPEVIFSPSCWSELNSAGDSTDLKLRKIYFKCNINIIEMFNTNIIYINFYTTEAPEPAKHTHNILPLPLTCCRSVLDKNCVSYYWSSSWCVKSLNILQLDVEP